MSGQNDVGNEILNLLANPFSSQVQTVSIYVALGLSLGTIVVITLLFSLLRPYHNAIYAPKLKHADKKHAPPILGKGLFDWIGPVFKATEMDLVEKIGMDGALFIRFTKMLRNIFIILTVIGCGILIPVHVISSIHFPSTQATKKTQNSILLSLTPQFVTGQPLWAHVVFIWISDFVILYFLWSNYKSVVRLRRVYFESPAYQDSVHGRSLMVRDIKRENRSDQGVLQIVDSVTHVASIPRTAIARNMKKLPELLEEHEETVRKLESVLAKHLKNPDHLPANRPEMRVRGKGKVDAIEHLTTRIQELEVRIRDVRETIDKRNPEPYGFASYESIADAHQVAWQARNKKAMGSKISLSPSPRDIIWKNMPLTPSARRRKRFVANFWVAVLTALYIVPNAFVAIFLANLNNLAAIWPAFQRVFYDENNRALWGVVQAILAPSLFSLFYLALPSIFRRISERAGDHTKTSRERHVTHKLYAFFVFNNLIVFSIFSALWAFGSNLYSALTQGKAEDAATTVIQHLETLPLTLLSAVCTLSPFWVVWLLQRNMGAAIDLAQIVNMALQWFKRTFLAPTPREMIELTAPPPFDYASYYHYFLYYATVATVFSTIQPIVLPIALLFFIIDSFLKKYLLMYVFTTKTESGGQFWNVVHNRMLFMTLLQNIIGALVILGANIQYENERIAWAQLAALAPLPFILLAFKIWIGKTLAPQARFYARGLQVSLDDAETFNDSKKTIKAVSSRLLNPVMTKPLITPMVHARAQHALAQIYRGRMESNGDGSYDSVGYGEIPMSDMGKKKGGNDALSNMFEIVQENQLDFANFKNRAEFRDEFGGGGELYGRDPDAMTQRSATPASFMAGADHAGSDGELTRYGTPEPMPLQQHPAYRQPAPGQQGPYGNNPAQGFNVAPYHHPQYQRSDSFGSQTGSVGSAAPPRPNFYRNQGSADSARRLVGAAQPMGYAPVGSDAVTPAEELNEREAYGLDRWRTGGQGYNQVSGDLGDTTYGRYGRR